MKFKSVSMLTGALLIAAVLGLTAGTASAITYFNIYGASAQYNLFTANSLDSSFLGTGAGGLGCTTYVGQFTTADASSAVSVATGCPTSIAPDGEVHLSYTKKASWDGVEAVGHFWDQANYGQGGNNAAWPPACPVGGVCTGSCPADNLNEHNYRWVANCAAGGCGAGNHATYTCQPIHVGASDVEPTAFSQQSTGSLLGPLDPQDSLANGVSYTQRSFLLDDGLTPGVDINFPNNSQFTYTDAIDLANYAVSGVPQPAGPIAYPFAFYVSPGVTASQCVGGTTPGQLCSTTGTGTQTYGCAGGGTCTSGLTITNLSRLQIVSLFAGKIKHWSDFGEWFTDKPVTLCMRHAGSGTHATLDLGVMQGVDGNGWGDAIVQTEQRATNVTQATLPIAYFNDQSTDIANCLNWAGNRSSVANPSGGAVDTYYSDPNGSTSQNGAIGYQDGDKSNGTYYTQVLLDGVLPNRATMRNGVYNNFWTINRMLIGDTVTSAANLTKIYQDLYAFLTNPTNITASSKGDFYGTSGELYPLKSTSLSFPDGRQTPTNAQLP